MIITLMNVNNTLLAREINIRTSEGMETFGNELSALMSWYSWDYGIQDDKLTIDTPDYNNVYELPDMSMFGEVVHNAG